MKYEEVKGKEDEEGYTVNVLNCRCYLWDRNVRRLGSGSALCPTANYVVGGAEVSTDSPRGMKMPNSRSINVVWSVLGFELDFCKEADEGRLTFAVGDGICAEHVINDWGRA